MRSATTSEKRSIVGDLFGAEDKLSSFSTYFKVYDSLTTPQYTTVQIQPSALNSHDDIRRLALELRADPHSTREEFKDRVFPQNFADPETAVEQERAINVAVQLMLMIDCSDKDRHCEIYEVGGFRPVRWQSSERFTDFVKKAFPNEVHDQGNVRTAMKEKNALKCWKLKKRAHIKFLPTDNLAEHMLYDPEDGVVLDEKSSRFLENLVQNSQLGFDPDCLLYEGYIRPLPENFEYHYWGNRLAKLHYVVTNPRPSHRIGQWIQRHASERNALFVAILSLVLSAFFGFLSVVLGLFQVWLAYQSWKAPMTPPPVA
ncbi:unnamed protein product [Sphagnum balticum]